MKTVYCGDYTALTTTKWGAKIYVDTRDTSLAPHIMLDGDWEPWVTHSIAAVLDKYLGATFIDVGANLGWYTLLACKVGQGPVYSFEPNPRMCELLRKTIAVNGYGKRVTLTEAACGAEPNYSRLWVDPTEAGGAFIAEHRGADFRKCDPVVRIARLDDIVLGGLRLEAQDLSEPAASLTRPVVMKVDVEGYEPEVLLGAQELMKLGPIMFLEHHQAESNIAMLQGLYDLGYELRHVPHKAGLWGLPLQVSEAAVLEDAETIVCAQPGVLP